jgi:enoyl-CoA hydratase/carnithine racemase
MSVNGEFVNIEARDDGVTVVRLDRPPANALSRALLEELAAAARSLATQPPGAVVITGSERIFAAGADITEFGGPEEAAVVGGHFREALDLVASIPRPVIAAVNGYALGGGCELALACDLRVAADNATFGQPEITLGIIPGGGSTQRLARRVGPSRAKDLIFTGRQVQADEALRIGLVDRVVPAADVLDETLTWAGELARGPSVALALAKRAIDDGLETTLAGGLDIEHDLFTEVFRTDDAKAGVASFLDKGSGKATFRGR